MNYTILKTVDDNSVTPSCINSWFGCLPWITWTYFYPLFSWIHKCVNNVDKKSGKPHKNVGFKPGPIMVTIQYKTKPELRLVATLTCAPFGPCGPGGPSGPCNMKPMSLQVWGVYWNISEKNDHTVSPFSPGVPQSPLSPYKTTRHNVRPCRYFLRTCFNSENRAAERSQSLTLLPL